MDKSILIPKWPAWTVFIVLMAAAIKCFGSFFGLATRGPIQWTLFLVSVVVILVLLFGIKNVRGAPKEFGHYFFLGRLTGWSLSQGVWPTFGDILSVKVFPADQELIKVPVTVTCASEVKGSNGNIIMPGQGPDVTVDIWLEAALDPQSVSEIVALGSVDTTDIVKFREQLKEFVVSKISEHAKNAILKRTLNSLNADRFELIIELVQEMWYTGTPPQDPNTLKTYLRAGTTDLIQGLVVTALRVNSVSEPQAIKDQRTQTQVKIASLETAQAELEVAKVREAQNKMEAERFAEILAGLQERGVPKEQLAVIAGALADKIKASGTITVVSTDGNKGSAGVAQASAQGAALGQGLASGQQGGS